MARADATPPLGAGSPRTATTGVGGLLRSWRAARSCTQLALALRARVSSRHLSYVETGRATPSRELLLRLAEALEVPLRERNALLAAAGYSAAYGETPLDAGAMAEVRGALVHILAASEPNPAMVVDRRYDIRLTNDAALQLLAFFAPAWRGRNNLALMFISPEGLRPAIANWAELAPRALRRIREELSSIEARTLQDEQLLRAAVALEGELGAPPARAREGLLLPICLRRDGLALELFTTITTLGTPLDVTLQELRIETLFPATEAARVGLARLRARSGEES